MLGIDLNNPQTHTYTRTHTSQFLALGQLHLPYVSFVVRLKAWPKPRTLWLDSQRWWLGSLESSRASNKYPPR